MKKFKIWFLAIAVITIGSLSAFIGKQHIKKADVTYHYTSSSTSLNDMKLISNWQVEEPGCGSSGSIPCAVIYDEDVDAFQSYLNSFTSVQDLTAAASERKTP
jgi:hypothetical protein